MYIHVKRNSCDGFDCLVSNTHSWERFQSSQSYTWSKPCLLMAHASESVASGWKLGMGLELPRSSKCQCTLQCSAIPIGPRAYTHSVRPSHATLLCFGLIYLSQRVQRDKHSQCESRVGRERRSTQFSRLPVRAVALFGKSQSLLKRASQGQIIQKLRMAKFNGNN